MRHTRSSTRRQRTIGIVALVVATLSACGEDEKPRGEAPAKSIVGEWTRVTTCEERVKALSDASLERFAAEHIAGEGWVPGVTSADQIRDPKQPCKGAEPVEHGHFFTGDGLFGSRDANGEEVDDGTYRLTSHDTMVISKEFGDVTFHYIVDGDELILEPVMPDCAESGCFAAQWAVAMSYPGLPWQRVP